MPTYVCNYRNVRTNVNERKLHVYLARFYVLCVSILCVYIVYDCTVHAWSYLIYIIYAYTCTCTATVHVLIKNYKLQVQVHVYVGVCMCMVVAAGHGECLYLYS